MSTTSEVPVSARSAAAREIPGPHIIPCPDAQATVTPSSGEPAASRPGPRMGRWSGVYSMVAAHTLRRPSPRVAGTTVARRSRICSR